jgi:uncharacterized protein (TIGR00251 family)
MEDKLSTLLEKFQIVTKQNAEGLILNFIAEIKPQAKNDLLEWKGDYFKVSVKAQAVEGKANSAVRDFLAKTLHISKASIELIKGDKSRKKTFLVFVRNDKLKSLRETLEKIYAD